MVSVVIAQFNLFYMHHFMYVKYRKMHNFIKLSDVIMVLFNRIDSNSRTDDTCKLSLTRQKHRYAVVLKIILGTCPQSVNSL